MNSPLVFRLVCGTAFIFLFIAVPHSDADTSTWSSAPISGDWNTAENWIPAQIPNGPADIAVFAQSEETGVTLSEQTIVRNLLFNPDASSYAITIPDGISLTVEGSGITNKASAEQSFLARGGTLAFDRRASAGANSIFTSEGSGSAEPPGLIEFAGASSAGSGTFVSNPGVSGGLVRFFEAATSGQANFVNIGASAKRDRGGMTQFFDHSSAGTATFSVEGATKGGGLGGLVEFFDYSSAGSGVFTTSGGTVGQARGGRVSFFGNADAGNASFSNSGPLGNNTVGATDFHQNSSAGHASFTVSHIGEVNFFDTTTAGYGSFVASQQGLILFYDSSSAGNGSFTIFGRRPGETTFGFGQFNDQSSGGNATFTLTAGLPGDVVGGTIFLTDSASGGNATFVLEGGVGGAPGAFLIFFASATGGSARLELLGNSSIDISAVGDDGSGTNGITAGSIEGTGDFYLGGNTLTVGSNALDTVFSGVLHDGGEFGGSHASLTKIGSGSLLLTGDNTYTGSTTVQSGVFGGTSLIKGSLTIGVGTGAPANLSPGSDAVNPATLTANGSLTFNSDGIYNCELDSDTGTSDSVTAPGIVIVDGAICNLTDLGSSVLSPGKIFTLLHNASGGPIIGSFSNMPDTSVVVVGLNRLQASYSAGSGGSDLTLTVVE